MENSELCGENKKSENEKKESGLSTEETLEQINSEMNSTEKKTLTLVDSSSSDDLHLSRAVSNISLQSVEESPKEDSENVIDEDYLRNADWIGKEKHVFVLSSAGKPIYSRYGNEDKLAGLCGVIQALVSVAKDSENDSIRSIHTPTCTIVFLATGPLILASVSKTNENETQLSLQLSYVYNQIISVLSYTQLSRIFEQRKNYDLRRLLSGDERLIDHLIVFMEKDPAFMLGAVRCLPIAPSMRDNITGAIISACNKIKDLVFAILIAENQLISLVRMKKYTLHPSDIHLIFNLVKSSESFKTAESWTPICLPKFDKSGFLHGHVSYLSDDCQACLLLLTVQRDAFYVLSQAKETITEKLRKTNCLEAINDAMKLSGPLSSHRNLCQIGVPELRHFIYKCRSTAQLFSSDPPEYIIKNKRPTSPTKSSINTTALADNMTNKITTQTSTVEWKLPEVNYLDNYRKLNGQLHCSSRPSKLIYKVNSDFTLLAWMTENFELYVTLDPLVDKELTINTVDKLLKWIKKEEDRLFIMNAPTF